MSLSESQDENLAELIYKLSGSYFNDARERNRLCIEVGLFSVHYKMG